MLSYCQEFCLFHSTSFFLIRFQLEVTCNMNCGSDIVHDLMNCFWLSYEVTFIVNRKLNIKNQWKITVQSLRLFWCIASLFALNDFTYVRTVWLLKWCIVSLVNQVFCVSIKGKRWLHRKLIEFMVRLPFRQRRLHSWCNFNFHEKCYEAFFFFYHTC